MAIIVILVGILVVVAAIAKLVFMVTLFLAPPFGTIAYFALFGFFPKGGALALLSTLMALKLAFCVMLFLAQQRFVQNKGLVLLVLTVTGHEHRDHVPDRHRAVRAGEHHRCHRRDHRRHRRDRLGVVTLVIAIIAVVRSARFDRAD